MVIREMHRSCPTPPYNTTGCVTVSRWTTDW